MEELEHQSSHHQHQLQPTSNYRRSRTSCLPQVSGRRSLPTVQIREIFCVLFF